jgi:hypothetical protein
MAVHAGKHDIEKQQIRLKGSCDLKTFLAIVGRDNTVSGALELKLHDAPDCSVVLDYQNRWSFHACLRIWREPPRPLPLQSKGCARRIHIGLSDKTLRAFPFEAAKERMRLLEKETGRKDREA